MEKTLTVSTVYQARKRGKYLKVPALRINGLWLLNVCEPSQQYNIKVDEANKSLTITFKNIL